MSALENLIGPQIQSNGAPVVKRSALNIIGGTAVDNATYDRTDITFDGLPAGTLAGSFVTYSGSAWVEGTDILFPTGSAHTIGVAATSAGNGKNLTISAQNTTAALGTGGHLLLRSGEPGAGGTVGRVRVALGSTGEVICEFGAALTQIKAPVGGTIALQDGLGVSMIDIGADNEMGFFGVGAGPRPSVDPLSATLAADLHAALLTLGLITTP